MTNEDREWLIKLLNVVIDEIIAEGKVKESVTFVRRARDIYNELKYGVDYENSAGGTV